MSLFEYMMHRAAPILFWTSVLLFIGGVAITLLLDLGMNPLAGGGYGEGSILNPRTLVHGIYQGLNAAVWPFFGAGLIWNLQRRNGGMDK